MKYVQSLSFPFTNHNQSVDFSFCPVLTVYFSWSSSCLLPHCLFLMLWIPILTCICRLTWLCKSKRERSTEKPFISTEVEDRSGIADLLQTAEGTRPPATFRKGRGEFASCRTSHNRLCGCVAGLSSLAFVSCFGKKNKKNFCLIFFLFSGTLWS